MQNKQGRKDSCTESSAYKHTDFLKFQTFTQQFRTCTIQRFPTLRGRPVGGLLAGIDSSALCCIVSMAIRVVGKLVNFEAEQAEGTQALSSRTCQGHHQL